MNDGINLGGLKEPQLQYQKHPCARCGLPVDGVGCTCRVCLKELTRRELLARVGAILAAAPSLELAVATDDVGCRHIVMLGVPGMAFCGTEVTQAKKRRLYRTFDLLPKEICPTCQEIVEKAGQGGYAT